MKFQIGCLEYASKKDAKDKVRSILNSQRLDTPLDDPHFELISALLDHHPGKSEKVGCGIASIEVRINTYMKQTRGFWIVRIDGSEVPFSYLSCFHKESHESRVKAALRRAVRNQCDSYLEDCFSSGYGFTCCLSLESIERRNADVDHAEPNTFAALVSRWMNHRKLSFKDVEIKKEEIGESIADDELRQDWERFHYEFARLRVVSKDAHKAITHGWVI